MQISKFYKNFSGLAVLMALTSQPGFGMSQSALETPEGRLLEQVMGGMGLPDSEKSTVFSNAINQYTMSANVDSASALHNLIEAAREMGVSTPAFESAIELVQKKVIEGSMTSAEMKSLFEKQFGLSVNRHGAQLASNDERCPVTASVAKVGGVMVLIGFGGGVLTHNENFVKVATVGGVAMLGAVIVQMISCK